MACSLQNAIQGTFCWYKNPNSNLIYQEVIILDSQISSNGQQLIEYKKKPITVNAKNIFKKSQNNFDAQSNLVKLDILNQAEIFIALKQRYEKYKSIYTYIGNTLISINPFHQLDIYTAQHIKKYNNFIETNLVYDLDKIDPHIYSIAANTFYCMKSNKKNQAVLITGQSGAGKTQSLKYLIGFLCESNQIKSQVNEKILACNPILQAFGNAQTSRNANSSRFGKFIKIFYNESNKIIGASLTKYLLEKSRVISQNPNENNYHIFSMIFNGMSKSQLEKYRLDCKIKYNYLLYHRKLQQTNEDKWKHLIQLFYSMGFSNQEFDSIIKILAAILNLGNIQYDDKHFNQSTTPCEIINKNQLQNFCHLLGCNQNDMLIYLTHKSRIIGKNQIYSPLRKIECENIKNCLSKNLYQLTFEYVVTRINETMMPWQQQSNALTIGMLDIFGFECFQKNSLEQIFINYANQKLQQIYLEYIFKAIEKDLINQQVDIKYLAGFKYTDNKVLINSIEKGPTCLFDILNDSCSLSKDDDYSFLNKLTKNHTQNQSFKFKGKQTFIINHSAKPVEYNVNEFRMKNMDNKNLDISINNKNIQNILIGKNIINPIAAKNKFICTTLKKQLNDLLNDQLVKSNVFFIRCIKPNQLRESFKFDNKFVVQQIRYLGILQSVNVRKIGFVQKIEFKEFLKKFWFLRSNQKLSFKQKHSFEQQIQNIEQKLKINLVKGKKKIFLRESDTKILNTQFGLYLETVKKSIVKIQKQYRRYKSRKQIVKKIKELMVQRNIFSNLLKLDIKLKKFYFLQKLKQNLITYKQKQAFIKQNIAKIQQLKVLDQLENNKKKDEVKIEQKIEKIITNETKIQQNNENTRPFIEQKKINFPIQQIEKIVIQNSNQETKKILINQKYKFEADQQFELWSPNLEFNNEPIDPNHIIQSYGRQQHYSIFTTNTSEDAFTYNIQMINKKLQFALSFDQYCLQNLNISKYSNKQQGVKKVMSHQNKNLKSPLLIVTSQYYQEESDFSFRCILKVTGQRNSRYSFVENMNNIVNLMMGKFIDKENGKNINLLESFKQKSSKETSRISLQTYRTNISNYSSRIFTNIQTQIVKNKKQAKTKFQIINKFEQFLESPLHMIRDEIYLQMIKQYNNNPEQQYLKKLIFLMQILTRYFAPSITFIFSMIKFLKQRQEEFSNVLNNLYTFAYSYIILKESSEISDEQLDYRFSLLQSRKTLILSEQINKFFTINIKLFNNYIIKVSYSNQRFYDIKKTIIQYLKLSNIFQYYSFWFSIKKINTNQQIIGKFIHQNMKVVDFITKYHQTIQQYSQNLKQHLHGEIYLKIKYYFPFLKIDKTIVKLMFDQMDYQIKNKKYSFANYEEYTQIISYCLGARYGKYNNTNTFKESIKSYKQYQKFNLSQKIEEKYMIMQIQSQHQCRIKVLQILNQSNPHIYLSHQYQSTYFQVQKSKQGVNKSSNGFKLNLLIKPSYIVLLDIHQRNKIYEIIHFDQLASWGLSKGKTTCLLLKKINQQLRIFSLREIRMVQQMITDYISLRNGKKIEQKQSLIVKQI